MLDIFNYSFIYYVLCTSVFLSILFALISFVIVMRRLSFLSMGIEHAAFGGVGIAKILNLDYFLTNLIFCTLVTLWAGKSHKKNSDTGISLFFSGSMALGMFLLSLNADKPFNLTSFLFGDLVSVSGFDAILSFCLMLLVFVVVFPALGKIVFISFDRDAAQIAGVNVELWDTILYIIIAISIVIGIKFVGVLLVSVMTVLPMNFALIWEKHTIASLWISMIFSFFVMTTGIILSLFLDIAPGALIALLGLVVYFICQKLSKKKLGTTYDHNRK